MGTCTESFTGETRERLAFEAQLNQAF